MRGRLIVSTFLLLALLSLGVPPAQAQTPTPTMGPSPTPASYAGFFWVGEALSNPVAITTVSPTYTTAATVYCNAYGGYVAASIIVMDGTDGTVLSYVNNRTTAGASLSLMQRTTTRAGKLIYTVVNQYFTVPGSVIDSMVETYSAAANNTEAYVDMVNHAPATNVNVRAALVTATVGSVLGVNVLCYVPPPPVAASATPTMTATPPDVYRATTTAGAQYNLVRTVTYGDVAVTVATMALFVLLLFALFLWSPRLRL